MSEKSKSQKNLEYLKKTRYKSQTECEKKNAVRYTIKVFKNTDPDIIAKLDSIDNKSGYIKQLIRDDIEKNKKI